MAHPEARYDGSMRRIFVGDVQGCHDELRRLLDEVSFDPAVDRLYSVGDAVNRGPSSAAVVRTFRELDATMVLGNHELHLFEAAAGLRWHSDRDTLQELLEAEDREQLLGWLRERPLPRRSHTHSVPEASTGCRRRYSRMR